MYSENSFGGRRRRRCGEDILIAVASPSLGKQKLPRVLVACWRDSWCCVLVWRVGVACWCGIRLIYDVMHETEERYLDGFLFCVDFEKAFDSVSREFVYDCLSFFGFGKSLIRWVEILTNEPTSCIVQNRYKSEFFPIQRSKRQGDPMSSYLYLLCA